MRSSTMRAAGALFPLIAAGMAPAAMAQSFPDKPVRVMVAFPPGGLVDTYARVLQPRLAEAFGQQVVVENRGGAGGTLAEATMAKTAPDGYTVMMSGDSVPSSPHLYKGLSYDLFRDLLPVSMLARVPLTLVVHPSVPANNAAEFAAWARSRPGQVTYGSPGTGTSNQFAAELFKQVAKFEMTHVPYKGGGQVMIDLVGGQIQASFSSVVIAQQQVKGGKLKAIGVASDRRSALLPDAPTFIEAGYKDFIYGSWSGLFVPAGTPAPVVSRLHSDFAKALRAPDVEARLRDLGTEAVASTPAEFAPFLRAEHDKLGRLIRELNIAVN
jgi:tripartite-type tricarboxylate transporter receptor subunit TctC